MLDFLDNYKLNFFFLPGMSTHDREDNLALLSMRREFCSKFE